MYSTNKLLKDSSETEISRALPAWLVPHSMHSYPHSPLSSCLYGWLYSWLDSWLRRSYNVKHIFEYLLQEIYNNKTKVCTLFLF